MPDPGPILLGVIASALTAGVVLLAGRLLGAHRAPAPAPGSIEGLALSLGYAAGHPAAAGWPSLPPLEAADWLFWLALATAAGSLALAYLPRRAIWIPRALLAAAVPALVLWPLRGGADWLVPLAAAGIAAAAAAAWGMTLDRVALRRPGASLPLILTVAAATTAVALLRSGSLRLAQLAGALAASLGAVLVLSLGASPPRSLAGGGLLTAGTVFFGLWLAGWGYADLPAASAALLALSPIAAWALEEMGAVRRLGPRSSALVLLAAAAVPLAVALVLVWRATPPFTE